jgi:hypothetical protein
MMLLEVIKQIRACKDVEVSAPAKDVDTQSAELPHLHMELLRWSNGLMGYGGYFRILPITVAERRKDWLPSVAEWNLKDTWQFAWPEGALTDFLCFGETAWGDQYAYKRSELSRGDAAPVYLLDAVAMRPEELAGSFGEFVSNDFIRNCRAPYDSLLVQARQKLGTLLPSEHIAHVPSVLLTGSEDIKFVQKMMGIASMIANGDMASQLLDESQSRTIQNIDTYIDASGRTRLKVVWAN